MTEGVQVGRIYEGRVTSIKDFGAFVEILPGKDGLVHISELSDGYVGSVTDICRVGDPMLVKAIAVDDQDRVKLSRKAALAERGEPDEYASAHPAAERPPAAAAGGPGGDRGGPPRPRRPRRRPGGRGGDRGYGGDRGPRPRTRPRRSPSRPAIDRARRASALAVGLRADSPVGSRDPPGRRDGTAPDSSTGRSATMADAVAMADLAVGPSADGPRPDRRGRDADEPEINRRLRAQYAEIAQLAGGLAHEIRNPLSTMSLNLDLLAEDFQDAETPRDRRVLQKIERLRSESPAAPRHPRGLPPVRPGPGAASSSRPT